jgi:hypothetical protein
MIVTCALRVLDGFDTIDLFEQAVHTVFAHVDAQVRTRTHSTYCVCDTARKHVSVSHRSNCSELVACVGTRVRSVLLHGNRTTIK